MINLYEPHSDSVKIPRRLVDVEQCKLMGVRNQLNFPDNEIQVPPNSLLRFQSRFWYKLILVEVAQLYQRSFAELHGGVDRAS